MKIIVTAEEAKITDNIDCIFGYGTTREIISDKNIETAVYKIKKYYPFILKKEIAKIKKELSEDDKIIFDEAVPNHIKADFSAYTYNERCFFTYFPNIIKKFSSVSNKENLDICIISLKSDKAIFQIIDSLKDYIKTISIITEDEAFFDNISDYTWSEYGILANLKNFSDSSYKELSIILNKDNDNNNDFSKISSYTIDVYQKYFVENTNYLLDFSSFNSKKLDNFLVKKCYFIEKGDKITNLNWKFYKKS